MPRHTSSPSALARRRLPHVVLLPERREGWGNRLTELAAWCKARCDDDAWFMIGREFRFLHEVDAEAFAAEAGVTPPR